jgi:hypothetical protein
MTSLTFGSIYCAMPFDDVPQDDEDEDDDDDDADEDEDEDDDVDDDNDDDDDDDALPTVNLGSYLHTSKWPDYFPNTHI